MLTHDRFSLMGYRNYEYQLMRSNTFSVFRLYPVRKTLISLRVLVSEYRDQRPGGDSGLWEILWCSPVPAVYPTSKHAEEGKGAASRPSHRWDGGRCHPSPSHQYLTLRCLERK